MPLNLQSRISLVLCGVVVFTALVSSGLIFWRLDAQLVSAKIDDLARRTDIRATRFQDQVNELTRDTQIVAGSAATRSLVHAIANGGIDPDDGLTLSQLRLRLANNFREMLTHKPDYLQLRFIGVADDGRELVRVDRSGLHQAIRVVPEDQLQQKGDTDYFMQTMARHAGLVYLSPINLNREHGSIQVPHVPVIRASVVLSGSAGKIVGMVVINYDLRPLFHSMTAVATSGQHYRLVNDAGAYLADPGGSRAFDFEFGRPHLATRDFPFLAKVLSLNGAQVFTAVETRDEVVAARRMDFGPPAARGHLGIIASDSNADVNGVMNAVIHQIGMTVLILLALGLIVALWLARQLTRPITQMAKSLRHIDPDNPAWESPPNLSGDADELASALKNAFDLVKERTTALDKSNRELEQFAYVASHDLQEPVRTISSYSQLLDSQYGDALDDRAKKYLHFMVDSCGRMGALIHALLEFSRLGKGGVPERVDLNRKLANIIKDMDVSIQASGATINVGNLPTLSLYAVETRMLFQNLISNAIKYVAPGRRPVVSIDCERAGTAWLFSVTDNGLGIAPEHREKVFMIFQRLHGRSAFEGTGIGLAHCRKAVELHHGRIWVESVPNGGSRFRFLLNEVFPGE